MNELRILIARLGWPTTSARWWAMQELAAWLGDPAVSVDAESALLQMLRSRKLEAEVVEVLCIFWMAVQGYGYSPTAELAEIIPRPSLLSRLFVESCGLSVQAVEPDLKEVPEDFEIPDDFDGVQGVDLAKIFRTSMNELEAYSRLPFVRQMAFEWTENQEAYPKEPYQGGLWHFAPSQGKGLGAHISARSAVRAISAYLRTLDVAKQLWNMPPELASTRSLLALPVHPTLALLRPQRPDWFLASTNFDGDTEAVESAFRTLLDSFEKARPGDELIAFSSPVVMSMERCVEVSLVRWSQAAGEQTDDVDLAAHLDDYWNRVGKLPSTAEEPISTTTTVATPTFQQLVDKESKAWPLAETLDFDRIGYLQHDLYPSRLYLPTMPSSCELEIMPSDGQLEVKAEDQVVADLCYWNAGWGPARPIQFRGNCGTALMSHGTAYREHAGSENEPTRAFYFWQVRTLYRSNTLNEFSETLATGIVSV